MELSQNQREVIVEELSGDKGWGKTWLSRLLTLSFEAMFCHPSYGGNTNEIGWKWVDHFPSRPLVTKELMYPQIMKTIREN